MVQSLITKPGAETVFRFFPRMFSGVETPLGEKFFLTNLGKPRHCQAGRRLDLLHLMKGNPNATACMQGKDILVNCFQHCGNN